MDVQESFLELEDAIELLREKNLINNKRNQGMKEMTF